jgi:hypothetical protein
MQQRNLIDFKNFVIATRDSGYKSTASALAELIDNSIEAGATQIQVHIKRLQLDSETEYEIAVQDNGKGMSDQELNLALQFGGSTRFNSRKQLGRYGMGLPNSSLSQCKRVEVVTWRTESNFIFNYLDIDEIIEKNWIRLKANSKVKDCIFPVSSQSGTIVIWKKCDRLSFKYQKNLVKHIHFELGRIFRFAIWKGIEIKIDRQKLTPFDPLFMGQGKNLLGATSYGSELIYQVRIPGHEDKTSEVKVKFVELPVTVWSQLTNEEKRKQQISKCAGVSIIRSNREIDYGWFFMGEKRKENYDDWWRCEISFHPELDEVFGVTHTKQEIKETEFMIGILTPDLEQTARSLNNRVRHQFIELKKNRPGTLSRHQLERTDVYLPEIKVTSSNDAQELFHETFQTKGLKYEIVARELKHDTFFDVEHVNNKVILTVNTSHLFYDKIFKALHDRKIKNETDFLKIVELIIFAAARSELSFNGRKDSAAISDFKREWSSQLKTFIS